MTRERAAGGACPGTDDGWLASLDLEICRKEDKSVVAGSRQDGPLTIQSPFYPEGDVCHLYLLHPPAGVVGGDRLQFTVSVAERSAALLTTPGATKFYRTNGKLASQCQTFRVGGGASLEWLPQETIYFPDAYARLNTEIHLDDGGRFLGWEIHCLGLPVNGLDFGGGNARIGLQMYRDSKPLFIDVMSVTDEKRDHQAAMLRGYPVTATFIASGADSALLGELRDVLPACKDGHWAATLVEDLLILRYLGARTVEVRHLFVEAWKHVRPCVLGRDAVVPRIWAT